MFKMLWSYFKYKFLLLKYISRCNLRYILDNGTKILSKTVVITTGTFLKGQINIGLDVRPAGRIGDAPSIGLANTLSNIGFRMGRLKTGTPPRLKSHKINFNVCEKHLGDEYPIPFSFLNKEVWIKVTYYIILFFEL